MDALASLVSPARTRATSTERPAKLVAKPSILATAPDGARLVTNNAAGGNRDEWPGVLRRTTEKCGRTLASIKVVEPERDFPRWTARTH